MRPKDIGAWLNSIGMRKYLEAFVQAEIDLTVLPYLTEHHLEQLGVTTLGPRVKLMAAINKFKGRIELLVSFFFLSFSNLNSLTEETEEKDREKGSELLELARTLKEAVNNLTASSNRLAELIGRPPNGDSPTNKIQPQAKTNSKAVDLEQNPKS
jgi:hypothetical protein